MSAKSSVIEISASLQWCCRRDEKSGWWLADCDALNLTVGETTWRGMLESIEEGLNSLLRGLLEEGRLKQFLSEHGWRTQHPLPAPGRPVRFDVPFELLMSRGNDPARAISR